MSDDDDVAENIATYYNQGNLGTCVRFATAKKAVLINDLMG